MSCRSVPAILIAIFLALATAPINAEQSEEAMARIRVIYEKTSDIPDDVYLSSFLDLLNARFHGDPGRLASYVNDNLRLDNFEEAQEAAEFLMEVSAAIHNETNAFKRSAVCPFDKPRPSGLEVYAALNSVDDMKDEISRTYLNAIEQKFGEDKYTDFLAWMNSRKASTTIIRFDNAKVNEGKNPDMVRQKYCGRLDSMSANEDENY